MSSTEAVMVKKAEVLLVEDNVADLKYLADLLTETGKYTVRPANNGNLALQSCKAKLPEIVITDIMMPGLSGIELCRQLQQIPEACDVPVIFISSHEASEMKVNALESGGTDYITKPFKTEEILVRVKTHLDAARNSIARRRAEYDLKQSQILLHEMSKVAKVGGWEFFPDTLTQVWTEETFRILEVDLAKGTPSFTQGINFIAPEYQSMAGKAVQRAMESGEPFDQEWKVVTAKGNRKWVRATARVNLKNGKITSVSGSFQDLSERKQAEERFEKYFHSNPSISTITRLSDGILTDVNCIFEKTFGYSREETIGHSMVELGLWAFPEERARLTPELLEKGKLDNREILFKTKNGQLKTCLYSCIMLDLDNEKYGLSSILDISERKRAEEALSQSEQKYSSLFNAMFEGFALHEIICDENGTPVDYRFLDMNPAFERLTGLNKADVTGKTVLSIMPQTERVWIEKYGQVALTGEPITFENYSSALDRHYQVMAFSPKHHQFAVIFTDVTERKKTEDALQRSQKLESLGVLAGGIAHDFNNLLGGIYGFVDLSRELCNDEKMLQYLLKAMMTIERARGLTFQLLTFATGGAPVRKVGTLFPFVQETAAFALSGSNVSCHFNVQSDLSPCNFDKNQIGQVIDNLIINAKQAMPNGGTIEVSAQNVCFGEHEHPQLHEGMYVKIAVKDTGIGIPKNILPRIFDPFYTTKSTGHGLGLASCYSIINKHDGCIDVASEPGTGSTFTVYLPASKEATVASPDISLQNHEGSGIFLVMDDEIVMQETLRDMLELFGYSVVCTSNGTEAIASVSAIMRDKKELSGMIFDLTVPGEMGGKDAVAEIRKTDSKTPIFVTSGYAKDPIMANPAFYGFTASICKPFKKSDLSELLNQFKIS